MQAQQPPELEARTLQEPLRTPGRLDLSTLEVYCRSEVENNCLANLTTAAFSFELLHRAITQDNQQAREVWQRCVASVLRSWLHRHPRAEEACRLGSEEGYLAQTFERFWRTVTEGQLQASTPLPTVLRYLQACLNGVLLDALRSKVRPQGMPCFKRGTSSL